MTSDPPSLRVLRTGPQLLVQDLGRPGWAHLGVPPSGALDPAALALANRLVGNTDDAAGLELLLGGVALVAQRSLRLAVTGAAQPFTVDGRPRPWGEPVSVRVGQLVELGPAKQGLRAWLAVSGGVQTLRALGSASTDTFSGLGPAPLAAGDELVLAAATDGPSAVGEAVPESVPVGPHVLRIDLGPRDDWFTADSIGAMLEEEYVVSMASSRVGVGLHAGSGATLRRSRGGELASEGVVTGAVQVPRSGQPLIFLADHPVTGGYPVVAVVDARDLRLCAQLRPGQVVRFRESPDRRQPARPAQQDRPAVAVVPDHRR